MSKLWSFGDSFAAGCCRVNDKLTIIKTYAEYLADRMDDIDDYFISARAGASNLEIIRIILEHLPKIKKDDYVIILKTMPYRYPILPIEVNNSHLIDVNTNPKKQRIIHKNLNDTRTLHTLSPNLMNQEYSNVDKEDMKILSNYRVNFTTKYEKYYHNYYNELFDITLNVVKSLPIKKLCVFDYTTWPWLKDEGSSKYNIPIDDMSCECVHWSPLGHELFSFVLENYIYSDEPYFILNCDNSERFLPLTFKGKKKLNKKLV